MYYSFNKLEIILGFQILYFNVIILYDFNLVIKGYIPKLNLMKLDENELHASVLQLIMNPVVVS